MSHIEVFPDGISDVYLSSVSAINRKAGKYKDYFITLDHPPSIEQNPNHITDLFKPPSLSSLLESGRWDEALDKVRQILAMDKPHHEFSLDQLYVILLHLSSCFTIAFISEGIPLEEQIEEELDSLLRKKALLTRNKIYHWAERMMASLKSKTSDQIEDSHLQIASKVRTFIQENLAEGITLQIIADHIGLHPVYLSKVYKTVTHETIGDYIFRTRMERAAYLLRNTDLKIMEISAQLGFFATPHFIKIFKKHYGCTPQEYRNKDTYQCK
jgi:two-component system response regulator YesN